MDRFEQLKKALFMLGASALEDFLGTDLGGAYNTMSKDAIERMLDETYEQMPEEEFDKYCKKYLHNTEPTVTILPATTKNPITLMGQCAGVCQGGDVEDPDKNYSRGIGCVESRHGRVLEYPQIYAVLDGWSARVIREWYTHIGGGPTRLQSSTRYIDYGAFDYVTPPSILNESTGEAFDVYTHAMNTISNCYSDLQNLGVPKEDIAMLLPLGMTTRIVDRRNFRNVMDMSRQRMCSRAYHEYRELFAAYLKALSEYDPEWKTLIDMTCYAKCFELGYCPEKKGCGRMPSKPGKE